MPRAPAGDTIPPPLNRKIVIWMGLYFALALLPWWVLGPKAARLGFRYGYLSQAELVADRFQSDLLSGIMALVSARFVLA